MLFGLWARIGRRNHVLDGGPAVLRDVAMATNFLAQIAVGLFGLWLYDSDTQFDSRGGFSGSSYPMKT